MIHKEAWFNAILSKDDDMGGKIGQLLRQAQTGDEGALVEMVKLLIRRDTDPNFGGDIFPPFSDKLWAQYYDTLLKLERGPFKGSYWLQDWVWKAAAKKDVLPPIPKKEWLDISDPPVVEFTQSWEVVYQNEESPEELDTLHGMIHPAMGIHYNSEQTRETPHEEFKVTLAFDQLMDDLDRGWFVDGEQILLQEEWQDIPHEVTDMLEEGDEPLSYTQTLHIANGQKKDQILDWLNE